MDGQRIEKERRQHARFDFCDRLFFQMAVPADQSLLTGDGNSQKEESLSACIKNVGSKGCCLTLNRPLKKSQIIKMDFPLVQTILSIPTLAEIRWVRMEPGLDQYTVGLRFLL